MRHNRKDRAITRISLLWIAMRPLATVMVVIIGVVAVILVDMLVTGMRGIANPRNTIETTIFCTMYMFLFPIIICMPLALKGLFWISDQERVLHFSFREEMRDRKMKGISYNDKDWFIYVYMTRIIALRRDYIELLPGAGKSSLPIHRIEGRGGRYYILLKTINGKNLKIVNDRYPLSLLRLWLTTASGTIRDEDVEKLWEEYE